MRHSIVLKSLVMLVGVAVVGSVVVLGLRVTPEVRGDTEIPVVPDTAPQAADTAGGEDPGAYLSTLHAGDYTTYTHPVYGFSFAYPKEFELLTTKTLDLDETVVRHPRLPLEIGVYVRPREASEELLAYLTSLPEDYDAEPPEGADGGAAMLMALDDPHPGQYTRYFWFVSQDHLYEIQLHAPDRDLLELWARGFVYSDFALPSH